MNLKHKDNWPDFVEYSKEYNLDYDRTLILLAMLEMEDDTGNELYKLESKGRDLNTKSRIYSAWLRNRDYHYQNYLKRLSVDENNFTFLEYIFGDKKNKIEELIKEINKEFSFKESA